LNQHESGNNFSLDNRPLSASLSQPMKIFRTILETEHGLYLVHATTEEKKIVDVALHLVFDGFVCPRFEIPMGLIQEFVDRTEQLIDENNLW